MNQFKTGDRVMLVFNGGIAAQPGAEAIVRDPQPGYGEYLNAAWIEGPLVKGQMNGEYESKYFRLSVPLKRIKTTTVIL
jgi:hypothetical protein